MVVVVVVKEMEAVRALSGAIRKFHDQLRLPKCRPPRIATRLGQQPRHRGRTHYVENDGVLRQGLERSITFRVSIRLE